MALLTLRTDDLNGDDNASTVVITVNGKGVEIDLADRSSKALMKALAPYWAAGTESDFDVVRREAGRRKSTGKASSNGHAGAVDPKAVRAWAEANGIEINARGRIPTELAEQYRRSI